MAISYVGKSSFAAAVGTLSVGAVAGVQAGDLILLYVENSDASVTFPAGYSSVGVFGHPRLNSSVRLTTLYRIADGPDTSTSVVHGGDHATAIKVAYRGVAANEPPGNTGTLVGTTITYPEVYGDPPIPAGAVIVHAAGVDRDVNSTTAFSSPANSFLTGVTLVHGQLSNVGGGGGLAIVSGVMPSAAASSGVTTLNHATTTNYAMTVVKLLPETPNYGSGSATEGFADSAGGVAKLRVTGAGGATDSRDGISATAKVVAIRSAEGAATDSRDTASATALVIVPTVPSTPAPWGDLGELARHELAANALTQDSGAVYAYAEMTASAGASATLHGGAKLDASLQAGAQATASLVGGMILSGELAASAAASAGFGTEVVFVGQAMFQTAVEADFQAAFTVESELTAEATATAAFVYAANPELHVTALASAQFHSSVAHSTAVHTGASSGATLAGATIATADMQAALQSVATLRGGAVAIGEASATAKAAAVMRASWSVGRDVQMQAGASFTARGESVVVGGLSATPKAAAVLVGDFGLSAEAILHTGAQALPSMRAGALHFAGMSVGATAHFNAHGGEVRTGCLTAAASGAFDPNAGQSYHAYLPPAREGVVVPADARGALVPFEDRAAVGEGVA